jgi:hypothetical protein
MEALEIFKQESSMIYVFKRFLWPHWGINCAAEGQRQRARSGGGDGLEYRVANNTVVKLQMAVLSYATD